MKPTVTLKPTRLVAIVVSVSSVLAACGGGEGATITVAAETAPSSSVVESTSPVTSPTASTTPDTTTTAPVELPSFPLTGLPITDAAWIDRPALIAKIDNAPGAWPQSFNQHGEGWTSFVYVSGACSTWTIAAADTIAGEDVNARIIASMMRPPQTIAEARWRAV